MQWTEWSQTRGVDPNARMNDIAVAGDRRWAVSTDGRLLSWTKGSAVTFTPLLDAPHARTIAFDQGGEVGWIGLYQKAPAPNKARLLKSVDGGQHWDVVASLPADCVAGFCGISVLNPELAFACGTYNSDFLPAISRTTNGVDWEALELPVDVTGLTDIEFWTPRDGMLIGQIQEAGKTSPVILLTGNGGKTWDRAHISDTLNDGAHGWKVHRCCDKIAYVTVSSTGLQGGVVLKSVDGGQRWNALSVTDATASFQEWRLQGVGFVDDQHGWVGQRRGPAFETTDGGWSWQRVTDGPTNLNRFALTPEGFYATGAAIYLRT